MSVMATNLAALTRSSWVAGHKTHGLVCGGCENECGRERERERERERYLTARSQRRQEQVLQRRRLRCRPCELSCVVALIRCRDGAFCKIPTQAWVGQSFGRTLCSQTTGHRQGTRSFFASATQVIPGSSGVSSPGLGTDLECLTWPVGNASPVRHHRILWKRQQT
eukprot:COSAG03_NODE_1792_length_3518_cov_11.157063_3_plen_166_part_00